MGKSVNETDPDTLRAAADMLKKQHDLVRTYDSDNYDNKLVSGDVVVAHGWNGQMAKVVSDHPDDFGYVLPKEGGDIWLDNMAIPACAQNVDAAYQFIDYVLEPDTAAQIVNGVNYASPNDAANLKIDPKILNDTFAGDGAEELGIPQRPGRSDRPADFRSVDGDQGGIVDRA